MAHPHEGLVAQPAGHGYDFCELAPTSVSGPVLPSCPHQRVTGTEHAGQARGLRFLQYAQAFKSSPASCGTQRLVRPDVGRAPETTFCWAHCVHPVLP